MMSRADAFALCSTDDRFEVLLVRELLGKAVGSEVIETGVFDDILQAENIEVELHRPPSSTSTTTGKRKRKLFQTRQYEPRTPKEESNWWRHYLCPDKRALLEVAEERKAANEAIPLAAKKVWDGFVSAFRVSWSVFLELKMILLERGFYDPSKKDILGFRHDLELLLLGSLHYIGFDTTFKELTGNTEID